MHFLKRRGHLGLQDLVEETCELVLGERANANSSLLHTASSLAALPFVPYHDVELRRRRKGRALRSAYAANHGGDAGENAENDGDTFDDGHGAGGSEGSGSILARGRRGGGGSMELAAIIEGREDGGYGDEEAGLGGGATESEHAELLRHAAHR